MTTVLSRGERWAFTPRRWWLYVIVAVALSLAGAVPLSALTHWLFPTSPTPDLGAGKLPAGWMIVLVAAVSPLIETVMMSGPLLLLDRLAGHRVAVAGSALLWALFHSLVAPAWGLVIWWPFLIFSTAFLAWRPRGYWTAVGTAATIHALNNLGPALLIGLS